MAALPRPGIAQESPAFRVRRTKVKFRERARDGAPRHSLAVSARASDPAAWADVDPADDHVIVTVGDEVVAWFDPEAPDDADVVRPGKRLRLSRTTEDGRIRLRFDTQMVLVVFGGLHQSPTWARTSGTGH